MFGYAHPGYAESFAEFGTPQTLPHCRGQVLLREVQDFGCRDAMGCYPLFACEKWTGLASDLEELHHQVVCLALVADPFGDYDETLLRECFSDVCIPFKDHFVAELNRPSEVIASKHHRYYARKAMKQLDVEPVLDPPAFLEEWIGLYAVLTERLGLKGIKAFSPRAFAHQLALPGLVMFRAVRRNTVVGAHLWYVHGDVAYSHLSACNEHGYALSAAYALYWRALEYFSGKVRWLHLGAAAGASANAEGGLTFFKRGWATGARRAYFCGRVFDWPRYQAITAAKGMPLNGYFPAYRREEFA